jgi:hypothetical protein
MASGQVEARDELAGMRQIEQGFRVVHGRRWRGYTMVMANISTVGVECEHFKLVVGYPMRWYASVTVAE